jgi:hypothetical protein
MFFISKFDLGNPGANRLNLLRDLSAQSRKQMAHHRYAMMGLSLLFFAVKSRNPASLFERCGIFDKPMRYSASLGSKGAEPEMKGEVADSTQSDND